MPWWRRIVGRTNGYNKLHQMDKSLSSACKWLPCHTLCHVPPKNCITLPIKERLLSTCFYSLWKHRMPLHTHTYIHISLGKIWSWIEILSGSQNAKSTNSEILAVQGREKVIQTFNLCEVSQYNILMRDVGF